MGAGDHEEFVGHDQPESLTVVAGFAVAVQPLPVADFAVALPAAGFAVAVVDLVVVIAASQLGEVSEAVVHKTASGDHELGPDISLVLIEAPTEIDCIVAEVGIIVAESDQEACP